MSAEAGGPLAQRGNGRGTCRHQPSSQIRIPLGDFMRIQGWWVSLNIHSFLSSIKILPSVILSNSEGFPRSRGPQHARFSHAGVVVGGDRGGVEGPRECVLYHAVTGNSTEDLLGFSYSPPTNSLGCKMHG